jgi:hypothetical protein
MNTHPNGALSIASTRFSSSFMGAFTSLSLFEQAAGPEFSAPMRFADIPGHLRILLFRLSESGFTGCRDFQDAALSRRQGNHKGCPYGR